MGGREREKREQEREESYGSLVVTFFKWRKRMLTNFFFLLIRETYFFLGKLAKATLFTREDPLLKSEQLPQGSHQCLPFSRRLPSWRR